MGDQESTVNQKVDKMVVNLTAIAKEQERQKQEINRHRNNTVLIKRILLSDGVLPLLSADRMHDATMLNTEKIELTEKEQVATPPVEVLQVKVEQTDTDKAERKKEAALKQQQTIAEFKKKKAAAAAAAAAGAKSSRKVEGNLEDEHKPPPKKAKKKEKEFSLGSDSEPEVIDEDGDSFGNPTPNSKVILPASNSKGRRVYGIKGSLNSVVSSGSFLLYSLPPKKTVYQFDDSVVKKVTLATLKKYEVDSLLKFVHTSSQFTAAGVFFAQELMNHEVADCPRPTFLDRPIISTAGKHLKVMFNEIPEPVRSSLYRFCKECGAFNNLTDDTMKQLALQVDEMTQNMEPYVKELRLNFPAVAIGEFAHAPFA